MGKVINVLAKVTSLNVSREQFKPYTYLLEPDGFWVEVPIPPDEIVSKDSETGQVVITFDGFVATLDTIASKIEAMHGRHIEKTTGIKRH
jgi:hypothetical protein